MKGRAHKKILNFRISDEFDVFLESVWRTSAYKKIGVKSKTDLFRYAVINSIGKKIGMNVLKEFANVDEIHNYLNPKPNNDIPELKENIKEYFKNRKKGGS